MHMMNENKQRRITNVKSILRLDSPLELRQLRKQLKSNQNYVNTEVRANMLKG